MLSRRSEKFIMVWDKGRLLKVCEKMIPGIHKEKNFEMRLPEKHKLPMFFDLNKDEREKISNMPRNTYMNF
jgi:hypothetical protein